MKSQRIVAALADICGRPNVLDAPSDLVAYSYDATAMPPVPPLCVVRPRSPEEISRILRLANEELLPVVPRGSGTGLSGGAIPVPGSVVLLTSHWTKILEMDLENQVATVEPGVITGRLQKEAESHGFIYPPDPGSASVCTIGGNVAENSGGLRGLKYGVTKNYVLGLDVILPSGELVRMGGKSVKDVAGYNLKDILVGSEGTLGIVTRIQLKLLPKPAASGTVLGAFPSMIRAAEAVSAVIRSGIRPAMLEFLDNTTIRCVEEYARPGLPVDAAAVLLAEADGHPAAVAEEIASIEATFAAHSATVRSARSAAESDGLKSARRAAFTSLARVCPTTIMEDVAVPRSELARLVSRIDEIGKRNGVRIGTFGHAGDGNLHPNYLTDERDASQFALAQKTVFQVEEAAIELGGTITGEHGVGLYKKPLLEKMVGSPGLAMMRSVKAVLDPNNILNPGKILDAAPRCEGRLPRSREQILKYEETAWV
jgi:glycolate oxidase